MYAVMKIIILCYAKSTDCSVHFMKEIILNFVWSAFTSCITISDGIKRDTVPYLPGKSPVFTPITRVKKGHLKMSIITNEMYSEIIKLI